MTFSHVRAKDRRHEGSGPWDAPSSAAPQTARAGSCTVAVVNHLLKNLCKVLMPELAPSRWDFCSLRLKLVQGQPQPDLGLHTQGRSERCKTSRKDCK